MRNKALLRAWWNSHTMGNRIKSCGDARTSDFIEVLRESQLVGGKPGVGIISYPRLTLDNWPDCADFELRCALLFLTLEIVARNDGLDIGIVNQLTTILKFSSNQSALVAAAFRIDRNMSISEEMVDSILNEEVPPSFGFYFMKGLLKKGCVNDALRVLVFFDLLKGAKTEKEGRWVIRCLVANGKVHEAWKFIQKVRYDRYKLLLEFAETVKVVGDVDDRIGFRVGGEFKIVPMSDEDRNVLRRIC
jgi:hypothetical protein